MTTSSSLPLITYVAQAADPAHAQPPADGNLAIEGFLEVLHHSHTRVERAASLLDIAQSLNRLDQQGVHPQVIQIVGHGAPGMLALGYYWDPSTYADRQRGAFLLDSNPYQYSILEAFVPRHARVILAGCFAGSDHHSRMVARGGSLIYDLHEMWGCDVLAADDFVGPELFIHGRYVGSARGYVRGKWVSATGRPPHAMAVKQEHPGLPFSAIALTAVPSLATASFRSAEIPEIETRPLRDYSIELEVSVPPLAMNEVSFTARDELGRQVELHLVCNSRYLKAVRVDGDIVSTRLFTTGQHAALTIDAIYNDSANPGSAIWAEIRRALKQSIVAS